MNASKNEGVRAVDRALQVLLAFEAGDGGLSVADLLGRVDLSRPTLYRLLRTLEGNAFVVGSGEPRRYRLGPAIARLVHAWSGSQDLAALAQPIMRLVWEETRETVAVFVPEGLYRVCIAEMPSPEALSFKRGIGYREKLIRGASGRAILAYGQDEPRELAQVRKRGFAVSRNELIAGAVAVAAPFFDGASRVAGSIGVFGPEVRMQEARVERYGKLLVRQAHALSRALGMVPA